MWFLYKFWPNQRATTSTNFINSALTILLHRRTGWALMILLLRRPAALMILLLRQTAADWALTILLHRGTMADWALTILLYRRTASDWACFSCFQLLCYFRMSTFATCATRVTSQAPSCDNFQTVYRGSPPAMETVSQLELYCQVEIAK